MARVPIILLDTGETSHEAAASSRLEKRQGAMVMRSDAAPVCCGFPESVRITTRRTLVTAAVGVPLISPVAALRLKPAGKLAAGDRAQWKGAVPPARARVTE